MEQRIAGRKAKFCTMFVALSVGFALSGCDNDSPVERAGEEVGEAVENMGEQVEKATEP